MSSRSERSFPLPKVNTYLSNTKPPVNGTKTSETIVRSNSKPPKYNETHTKTQKTTPRDNNTPPRTHQKSRENQTQNQNHQIVKTKKVRCLRFAPTSEDNLIRMRVEEALTAAHPSMEATRTHCVPLTVVSVVDRCAMNPHVLLVQPCDGGNRRPTGAMLVDVTPAHHNNAQVEGTETNASEPFLQYRVIPPEPEALHMVSQTIEQAVCMIETTQVGQNASFAAFERPEGLHITIAKIGSRVYHYSNSHIDAFATKISSNCQHFTVGDAWKLLGGPPDDALFPSLITPSSLYFNSADLAIFRFCLIIPETVRLGVVGCPKNMVSKIENEPDSNSLQVKSSSPQSPAALSTISQKSLREIVVISANIPELTSEIQVRKTFPHLANMRTLTRVPLGELNFSLDQEYGGRLTVWAKPNNIPRDIPIENSAKTFRYGFPPHTGTAQAFCVCSPELVKRDSILGHSDLRWRSRELFDMTLMRLDSVANKTLSPRKPTTKERQECLASVTQDLKHTLPAPGHMFCDLLAQDIEFVTHKIARALLLASESNHDNEEETTTENNQCHTAVNFELLFPNSPAALYASRMRIKDEEILSSQPVKTENCGTVPDICANSSTQKPPVENTVPTVPTDETDYNSPLQTFLRMLSAQRVAEQLALLEQTSLSEQQTASKRRKRHQKYSETTVITTGAKFSFARSIVENESPLCAISLARWLGVDLSPAACDTKRATLSSLSSSKLSKSVVDLQKDMQEFQFNLRDTIYPTTSLMHINKDFKKM